MIIKSVNNETAIVSKPLDVKLVVKHVSVCLERKFGRFIPFAIAGSYPSAVKAYERGLSLEYNDIDVYIHRQESDCADSWDGGGDYEDEAGVDVPNMLGTSYEEGVIPDSDIEVNLITMERGLTLQGLLDSYDINAIMVGFSVGCHDDGESPSIRNWNMQPAFEQFLESKVLKIVCIQKLTSPTNSLIRLLYKAQQLRLSFELPEESVLLDTLDEKYMGERHMVKFMKLEPEYKDYVTTRFYIAGPFFVENHNRDLYKFFRNPSDGERKDIPCHELRRLFLSDEAESFGPFLHY